MSSKKHKGLTRRASGLMALEPRFMFDGAAAADAASDVLDIHQSDHAAIESRVAPNLFSLANVAAPVALVQAQDNASRLISEFLTQPDARTQLFQIFRGGRNDAQPSEQWLAAYDSLLKDVQQGQNPVRVELIPASNLQNLLGAFAEQGLNGERVVYLNVDWIESGASSQAIELVLAEEFGHAIDERLNEGQDSAGDEGHAFASLLFNGAANAMPVGTENDQRTLSFGGQQINVEAAAPYAIAQTHYVPMAEADIKTSLYAISTAVTGNIQTVIAITATSNGTVVVYDHWEDGYEADINNPLQATTQVWTYNGGKWFVDANKNGVQDGGEVDVSTLTGANKTANQSVILYNPVNPAVDSQTVVDYDGRDKIGSTKAVTMVRAGWSATPGTVLAGAVNLIDSANSGLTYTLPVGQNVETVATGTNKLFEYTSAHIIATQDGTSVTIDRDGNSTTTADRTTVTLNQGQTYLVNGGLNAGAKITADKGIGVYLIAGDVGSAYENRWFALTPDEQWSESYFAPVGTTLAADPAYVILYNPGANPITVNYETATGTGTITVPATGSRTAYYLMPSSAAHFYTTNGSKFYAVSVIDGDATSNATHDWSYSLVPDRFLTDKFVVGWGPGADNVTRTLAAGDLNGSPVWVTPTANTTLYVDSTTVQMKDGSGKTINGTVDAGNGRTAFVVSKLQSYRIFDNDRDQSGLTAYTLDGTLITAAWGEDPSIAGAGTPYLDMGTTVTPYPDYVFTKQSAEASVTKYGAGVSDSDNQVELGEQIEYTLNLTNRSVVDLYGINIRDAISPSDAATYVANSTRITITRADGTVIVNNALIPDALDATPFPLLRSDGGYTITDTDPNTAGLQGLKRGDQIVITYRVQVRPDVNASLIAAGFAITNDADMSGNGAVTPIKFADNNTIISAAGTADGQVFLKDSSHASVVSTFAEGDTVGLEVTDADANLSGSVADTVTVTVTNTSTGEIEQVTLTETGMNTGIFRSTLPTSPSAVVNDNDGTLQLRQGQSIQVDYTDPVFGAAFDNPTNPGVAGDTDNNIATGNANRATASVPVPSETKILYFSDDSTNNLDRIKPSDATTASTALINASATSSSVTITDNFGTGSSYSATSGSGWSNGWSGSDALDSSDNVRISDLNSSNSVYDWAIQLRDDNSIVSRNFAALSSSAVLTFDIRDTSSTRAYEDDDYVSVQQYVSNAWAEVTKIYGTSINTGFTNQSVTLSAGATGLRFESSANSSSDRIYIDNIKIVSGYVDTSNTAGTTDFPLSSSVTAGQTFSFSGSSSTADAINVNSLSLSLKKTGTTAATATVSIRNAWDGSVLWSNTVSTAQLSTSYQNVAFNISGLTLEKSASYVLRVDSNASGIVWQGGAVDSYASGTRLTSSGSVASGDLRFAIAGQEALLSSVTFTQGLSMASDFTVPVSGTVNVVTHISAENGLTHNTSYANITAALTYVPTSGPELTIVTLGSATYSDSNNDGVGTLTWSGTLGSNVTIPAGANVKLVIRNSQSGASFKIDYDSSSSPSRIELPTTTVIDIVDADPVTAGVQEIGFFDQSFANGGQPIKDGVIDAGGIVYVRVKVVDPFGDYDISSLNLSIDDGAGGATPISLSLGDAYVVDAASDGRAYKTYEYAWQTGYNIGGYAINVTANEGLETGAQAISDVTASTFRVQERDLGTPSTTMFLTNLSSAGGIQAGALYPSTSNRAYLRVTDLDQSGALGSTVDAVVNGYTVRLTQTATPGIFEADLGDEANHISNTHSQTAAQAAAYFTNMPDGTSLSGTYVDPNDPSDTSLDTIAVNTAPDAVNNAKTIGMDKQAIGNVLTDSDGVDTDLNGQSLVVIAVNSSGSNIGDTITLPSGARLLVKSDGSYIYDPSTLTSPPTSGSPTRTDSFSYTISDGKGGVDTATVNITVNYVNPIVIDNQANTDGAAVEFDISGKFADQTGLDNFVITGLPSGLSYDADTGLIYGTIASNASSSDGSEVYTVSVQARDENNSALVTRTFTWTVTNLAPLAVNDTFGTSVGVAVSGNMVTNDGDSSPDNDSLSVSQINGSAYTLNANIPTTHGTLKITNANGAFTYTPIAGYTGADSFTYTISDGNGGTSTATVNLRIIGVNDIELNESSPWAVFEVGGAANEAVTLSLLSGTATVDANGIPLPDGTEDFGPVIQYSRDGGLNWETYTSGTVQLNSSGDLLVRTLIVNDTLYEGAHVFSLRVTNSVNVNDSGTATIRDDGAGQWFDGTSGGGNHTPPVGEVLDDDRPLAVNDIRVNEGSPFAVFTVTGKEGQQVKLNLSNGTATIENGTSPIATDGSEDFGPALQYWNGSAWTNYTANSFITIPSDGDGTAGETAKLLVRTAIHPDALDEGDHTFTLTATNTGGSADTGTATIDDHGGGVKFPDVAPSNPTTTDPSPATNSTDLDDDRAITVTGGDYNENSPRAVFTLNASNGQILTLDVQNDAQPGKAPTGGNEGKPNDSLDVADIYYSLDGGATWQLYTGPTVAGSVPVLVAVDITNERDNVYEGEEQLKLVVTSGSQSVSGFSSIFDDGTGTVTKPITAQTTNDAGANDPAEVKDDDRPVATTPPAAPPSPSLPAPPVLLAPPPPLATVVPSFASALTPLAPSLVPVDPPALSMIDAVTSGSGFQIPVSDTAPLGLSLYQGITDQFVQTTGAMSRISLPYDAFIHSNKDAVIKLEAKQADNSNLPTWVQFDPSSGVFVVTPPAGFKGKLDLKVIARDDDGREAVAIFQMFIGEQDQQRPQSRDSFTEKLRMAGKRPITLVRVSDASPPVPVREPAPMRVRAG